jgi:hypothetical protein
MGSVGCVDMAILEIPPIVERAISEEFDALFGLWERTNSITVVTREIPTDNTISAIINPENWIRCFSVTEEFLNTNPSQSRRIMAKHVQRNDLTEEECFLKGIKMYSSTIKQKRRNTTMK